MSAKRAIVVLAALLILAAGAAAWHRHGHVLSSRSAVALASTELPGFFVTGVETIAHVSQDSDAFTRPIGPSELDQAEAPEHYFDLELLGEEPVPTTRYAFIDFCAARKVKPTQVGLLPYAISDWTQRLTVALAEYRRWPDDPAVQSKCLVYAGLLAHYAADACQPLHVTIHWDGRAQADGRSPRSGIHQRLDALPAKLTVTAAELIEGQQAKPFGQLFPAILAEIRRSHGLVERVYELEGQLPPMDSDQPLTDDLAAFTKERMQAAAVFTGSLYLTAWRDSAAIEIPDWHRSFPTAGRPAEPIVLRAVGHGLVRPTSQPAPAER
jgi:hypothetical protein